MTETSLTIVDRISQEVGIPITDVEKIVGSFTEVGKSMSELDKELIEFNKHEDVTKEVCQEAKEIRLKFVKVRTRGDEIHKTIKEGVLLRTKAIDGVRNIYKLKATEVEAKLKSIELHFENIEQAKKDKINAERELELNKYVEDVSMYNFKEMNDEAFDNLIKTVKTAWDVEQETIKKTEDDRLDQEEKLKIHQSRKDLLVPFWQFLGVNDKETNFGELSEEDFNTLLADAEQAKVDFDTKQLEFKKDKEKLEADVKIAKDKADKDAVDKAKLQKEIDDKNAEDLRLEKEAELAKEKEAKEKLETEKAAELAPDKDKLLAYAKSLEAVEVPELQTAEAKVIQSKALGFLGQAIATLKTN